MHICHSVYRRAIFTATCSASLSFIVVLLCMSMQVRFPVDDAFSSEACQYVKKHDSL